MNTLLVLAEAILMIYAAIMWDKARKDVKLLERNAELLSDILSDTEADWAVEMVSLNNDMLENIRRSNKEILARDTAYDKLFESYEALQKSHNELQDDYRKLYRPKCPKCNRFMKDGKCSNPKCSKIDLSNLPETFDAETAGKVIEAEAPKPKPLLTDAKVGDLCKRRDGKWVQIDSNICMIGLQEENYEKRHRACRYLYNGSTIYVSFDGTCLYNHPDFDIISTEPLAPEGSKEWAWQQMLLRNMVCHDNHTNGGHYEMKGNIAYFTHAVGKIESDCTKLDKKSWIKAWGRGIMRNYVWQIYPEDIADDSKANETDNKAEGKQDLSNAPFEGLARVKEGDPILFSDGKIRNVRAIDAVSYVYVVPVIEPNCTGFNFIDGKHCFNNTPIRAIRIATPIDLKLYGGGE